MIKSTSQLKTFGCASKIETTSLISNEELNNIITQLETDIADGSWHHKDYSSVDKKIMPALIIQANNKYPEMNLKFLSSPQDFEMEIKKVYHENRSFRFIINMGEDGIHFSVIDCKYINGKTSLILFEPANFNSMGPAMLALRVKMVVQRSQLPDCYLSMVELDIQRSSSECGIFCLALAKKLYIERDIVLKMHEDNIKGTLNDSEEPLPHDKLDLYLPVTFYKHTQSKRRLNKYLNSNPHEADKIINKKNETILNRIDNYKSVIDGKEFSVSAHKKRITEYKTLLDL
ncbi:YopJ family type III secretion system effector serine/threonine acetyltransferase [Escherichia coli]|uniref:YopJ/AvrA family T3SS effector serine/threonine acetyltransferase n=1 Tax=Escherichia coli TaxID=562 RepID=UPI0016953744|nr:YopJ/AvrA family T3SS effector serine/threonine acetyltransferase [Escherichia coli]EFA4879779.1 YopJ family type III secretion system effector serine/threonine acetyltransferase [Escherichia coli]EFK5321760.1 YopJ family type III secretion system effector serine/threonine acetyltransferase [Escherichia coli]HAW3707797.1 YopJ family type III secretion system effector serine/threonine acetyltransferase [Escherichia coli]